MIWPGTLAGSGMPQHPMTVFVPESGQRARIPSVLGWSGRIWARTECTFDEAGMGTCLTGDWRQARVCRQWRNASHFALGDYTGTDEGFYDVSIVDGDNLPLVVAPQGVYGECNATGCTSDINLGCPKELQVVGGNGEDGSKGVIACRSACEAFSLDQYCCSGEFANPTTCHSFYYSTIFKRACLRVYSYVNKHIYLQGLDYRIIFCPDTEGQHCHSGLLSARQDYKLCPEG